MKKLFIFLTCLMLFSCASNNLKNDSKKSAYYENNINDFSQTTLSNGIPVIFKKNAGSQVAVLKLIFEGGVPLIPYEKSGLEDFTLDLMIHGSQKYSYQQIQKLEYDKSFLISDSKGKDYSSISLTCILRDLDESFDVFADGILNPLFLEKDFTQQVKLAEDSLQSKKTNPEGVLGLTITEKIFENHPYRTTNSVNEKSVKNISLKDVKNHHKTLLNASRMKFVIVSNLNDEAKENLIKKIDEYFGSIEKKEFSRPEIPELKINNEKVVVECDAAAEIGYIEGVYKCPERDSSEYVPFVLASMYIDDYLFSIVREKNSAVYSIGNGIIGARKLLGCISVFKATKFENLGKIIYEAIDSFPLTEKDVKKKLDAYKNMYLTSIFENSQNASGISANITSSLIYKDSPTQYLLRPNEIQSVTAKQVIDAYQKYFVPITKENAIKWIVISGKDSAKKFEL